MLMGRQEAEDTALWTSDAAGMVGMTAFARYR